MFHIPNYGMYFDEIWYWVSTPKFVYIGPHYNPPV